MRIYVLVAATLDTDYWYGYLEEGNGYWSGWCATTIEALTTTLVPTEDVKESLISELSILADSLDILYASLEPITIDFHPEYFI